MSGTRNWIGAALALGLTVAAGAGTRAWADDEFPSQDDGGIHGQVEAAYLRRSDSFSGASLGFAAIIEPFRDRWVFAGPRLTGTWADRPDGRICDLSAGAEANVWLMNVIGPGLGVDWVFLRPRSGANAMAFRLEPNLSLRVKRLGDKSAAAVRISGLYDSAYKWALSLGLTFQIGGVNP